MLSQTPVSFVVVGKPVRRLKERTRDATFSLSITLGGREDYPGKEAGCCMEMPTS